MKCNKCKEEMEEHEHFWYCNGCKAMYASGISAAYCMIALSNLLVKIRGFTSIIIGPTNVIEARYAYGDV